MRKPGKKSAAETDVLTAAPIQIIERPKCPHDLNDEESEVWFAVTSRLPADWFPAETHPLLTQYCRHVIQSRRIAEWIEQAASDPELSVKDYDRLLKMQERESRAISSLSTKMRLSQQTTYDKSKQKGSAGRRRIWES